MLVAASDSLPLLLHVLGASVLVGGLATAVAVQALGWRRQPGPDAAAYGRLAFRVLLFAALPGWILMRAGAQWVFDEQGWSTDDQPTWLGIGWATADFGLLLLLLALLLAGLGARRLRRTGGGSSRLGRAATLLAAAALVAYVVAVWAMSAKPV